MATLFHKIKKAISRPKLIRVWFYDNIVERINIFKKSYKWGKSDSRIERKIYKNYSDYIAHQGAKLDTMDLTDYDEKYYKILNERLKSFAQKNIVRHGAVVLCLAARIGTEVRVFLNYGCFAVGIDLNPGKGNKYVLHGDFHNIQFPDASVDVIFSNSVDHALNLLKLAGEVRRVLKPGGHIILEIGKGTDEGGKFGYYEASTWRKIDDCLDYFKNLGFTVLERHGFDWPWPGEQVMLQKQKLTNE